MYYCKCNALLNQSLAMKQLAATHRSAIRLLHSFAGMPGRPSVYQQLSELVQQLTLCCCQLGLDETQLLELNDQMKVCTIGSPDHSKTLIYFITLDFIESPQFQSFCIV